MDLEFVTAPFIDCLNFNNYILVFYKKKFYLYDLNKRGNYKYISNVNDQNIYFKPIDITKFYNKNNFHTILLISCNNYGMNVKWYKISLKIHDMNNIDFARENVTTQYLAKDIDSGYNMRY